VQRGDGDAAVVAGERGIDGRQRVVAAEKMLGTRIGMLETANTLPGKAAAAGASRFAMNSRKRMQAASSGTP